MGSEDIEEGKTAEDYVKPVGSATETGPSGPVPAPTKASFGTENHYARVDHIHPQQPGVGPGSQVNPAPTTGVSMKTDYPTVPYYDDPIFAPVARVIGEDADRTPVGWERGKTAWKNGHNVDADHPAVGCSITMCLNERQVRNPSNNHVYVVKYYAVLDFDENGLLVRVKPHQHWSAADTNPTQ